MGSLTVGGGHRHTGVHQPIVPAEHLVKATLPEQGGDALPLVVADLEDEPAAGAEMVVAAVGELAVEPQAVLPAIEGEFRFPAPPGARGSAYPPR